MNTNIGSIKHTLGCWLLGTTMGFMAATASAGVLLQQAPLDTGISFYSSIGAGQQNADNFAFGSQVKLDGIGWWGSYSVDQGDDFVVRIFSDNSGSPDTSPLNTFNLVASKTSTSLTDNAGQAVSYYEIAFASLDLQAGSIYYLSINNEASVWNWLEATAGNSKNWYRFADGDSWNLDQTFDFSFKLLGTRVNVVPEPSILPLFALGALSLYAGIRFRRRSFL